MIDETEIKKELDKIINMTQNLKDDDCTDVCELEDYLWYVSYHLANLRLIVDDLAYEERTDYSTM